MFFSRDVVLLVLGVCGFVLCCAAFFVLRCVRSYQLNVVLCDAIDASGQGMLFFDQSGRLISFNAHISTFFPDLSDDLQCVLKTYDDFLVYIFDKAVPLNPVIQDVLSQDCKISHKLGFREVLKWGENSYCVAEARRTDNGCVVVIVMDISDNMRDAENFERLNVTNQRLGEVIQYTDSGIIMSDITHANNPITFVNNAFCRMMCVDEEIIKEHGWGCFDSLFTEGESLDEYLRAVCNLQPVSVELQRESENCVHWYNVKLNILKNENDEPHIMVAILDDVTALKTRELQFFNVKKLESLGQLSAGVAHDFNNILSIIMGYAKMANKPDISREVSAQHVQRIGVAAQRGASLIQKLMLFSHHKSEITEVHDLVRVIRDQDALLKPLLGQEVSLRYDVSDEPLYVSATIDGVSQILMNLVINARDAMADKGGVIDIKLDRFDGASEHSGLDDHLKDQDLVRLCVCDKGAGIEKKIIDKIFDPFFTTKDIDKGTGLGLSVVYGLVQDMGGQIKVRSVPGQGTSFFVYLKEGDSDFVKSITGSVENIDDLRFEGYTALIVDDEPDILVICEDILSSRGMHVLTANDGNHALCVQDEYVGHIDVLLSDVAMPQLNGFRLAEIMRDLRPEIDVLHMSGYPLNNHAQDMDIPENITLLSKPIDSHELVSELYHTLNGE